MEDIQTHRYNPGKHLLDARVTGSVRVLVVGADGLLGSNVLAETLSRGWSAAGTYHTDEPDLDAPLFELDVRDEADVGGVLDRVTPDAVVNCAAMTGVDACEEHPDRAHETNAAAPGTLVTAAGQRDVEFVHVSTDYVFDGTARRPYSEIDEPNPRQVYGRTKLAGDRAVLRAKAPSLVGRLSFVYGVHRSTGELAGFPAWVRDRLDAGDTTPLFTDQHVSPTRARGAARTLLDLLAADEHGLFNIASRVCVTPHAFGHAVARRLEQPADPIARGSLADIDRTATRPAYTCLSTDRVAAALGREQPALGTDLDAIL